MTTEMWTFSHRFNRYLMKKLVIAYVGVSMKYGNQTF